MNPKKKLFERFALVAKSLASANRLELLEALAQDEKSMDSLAQATGMSGANTSSPANTTGFRLGGIA